MGVRLCKDCIVDLESENSFPKVGTYEELEDDPSAGNMVVRKPKLQISQHSLREDVAAENKHGNGNIEIMPSDETEMKPEPSPTDELKLSVEVSATDCNIIKEAQNEADNGLVLWDKIGESDIPDIGRSYVIPESLELEKLPATLLKEERQAVPVFSLNLNDLWHSKDWSSFDTSEPSLFRDQSERKWNEGRLTTELKAIKRHMEQIKLMEKERILEKERISRNSVDQEKADCRKGKDSMGIPRGPSEAVPSSEGLSPNKLAVPKNVRNITSESEDLTDVTGDGYEDVNDEKTGGSDSFPYSKYTILEKSMEEISDSASIKHPQHNSRECL